MISIDERLSHRGKDVGGVALQEIEDIIVVSFEGEMGEEMRLTLKETSHARCKHGHWQGLLD
jgi:hypothetical protein